MSWTQQVIVSAAEFLISFGIAVLITYSTYRSFDKINVSFDAQAEIYKGNTAVALLMGSMMYGSALVMRESIYPIMGVITVDITSSGYSKLALAAHALGHLLLGFLLAVGCVQFALSCFNRLNRELDEVQQIRKGNVAVSVIVCSVVLVISLYMQQGVGALTKSLVPQPELGGMRVMDDEPEGFELEP